MWIFHPVKQILHNKQVGIHSAGNKKYYYNCQAVWRYINEVIYSTIHVYSLAVCVFYVTSCTISFLCFTDNKASGISSAKRKILDSSPTSGFQPCSSPSKRFKAEASTHSVSSTGVASLPSSSKHVSGAAACSTVTYTISPIRINNSSKPIVNITPSSSVKGRIMSDQSLL
mgnify:CR=1 FL=1